METKVVSFNNNIQVVRFIGETKLGEHVAITHNGQVVVYCWVTNDAVLYNERRDGQIIFR